MITDSLKVLAEAMGATGVNGDNIVTALNQLSKFFGGKDTAFHTEEAIRNLSEVAPTIQGAEKIAAIVDGSATAIDIPAGTEAIAPYAFYTFTDLETVTVPDGVATIGDYAFGGCTSIESITLPASITTIGEHAFSGCTALTAMTVGWVEGAVTGAPWGATNATITYAEAEE